MAKKQTMAQPVSPTVDKEWQAENDARTLMQAEEIRMDEKRCAAAEAKMKKQMDYMSNAMGRSKAVKKLR